MRDAAANSGAGRAIYVIDDSRIERVGIAPSDRGVDILIRLVGQDPVGLSISTTRMFWLSRDQRSGLGVLHASSLNGQRMSVLVRNIRAPVDLVVAGGFVYWLDHNGIGRVATDGSHLTRHYITLQPESSGEAGDGLAADRMHLYVLRCLDGVVAKIGIGSRRAGEAPIRLPSGDRIICGNLTVDAGWLYWGTSRQTTTGSSSPAVGRIATSGKASDPDWLPMTTRHGFPPDAEFSTLAGYGDELFVSWWSLGSAAHEHHLACISIRTKRVAPQYAPGGPIIAAAPTESGRSVCR